MYIFTCLPRPQPIEELDGVEPEPEDVNPELEDRGDGVPDPQAVQLDQLDSEDDADDDDILISLQDALPSGFKVAEAPSPEQLQFKGARAQELVGRCILFNWRAEFNWRAKAISPRPTPTAASK